MLNNGLTVEGSIFGSGVAHRRRYRASICASEAKKSFWYCRITFCISAFGLPGLDALNNWSNGHANTLADDARRT
jgi:hypothetical protein